MKNYNRNIVIWLFSGCLLVFAMVMIGGITRLTGSGLSITEWKLVRGTIPPLNEQQWNEEFENYKKIPQYAELNSHYSLSDFKKIYFWEYLHRLIGRMIGLVFIIPFLYFYFTKQFEKPVLRKLIFIFLLGGFQGFLGWYMVKSGLVNNIRVSHLRLAAHLITAFFTFGFIFWTMLGIIFNEKIKPENYSNRLKNISWCIFIVTVIQIIYGAFVAGLKAGHIYNTFPKMGDEWIASAVTWSLQNEGVSGLVNNIAVVQFIHRCIAGVLTFLIFLFWSQSRKGKLTVVQKQSVKYLLLAVCVQVLLGIFTLIYGVPITLGVLHQAGAFLLFAATIFSVFVFTGSKSQVIQ